MKKFNALVIDCETHFKSIHQFLIFQIAWVRGNVRIPLQPRRKKEYYVREFLPFKFWEHSFVKGDTRNFWKNDSRAHDVQKNALANPHMVLSWNEIMEELKCDISQADGIGSYNWGFDSKAIDITNRKINHTGFLQGVDYVPFCIMDMYANKVINQDYFRFIDKRDAEKLKLYKTRTKKNLSYSAQTMTKYINRDDYYTEEHTALADSIMEFELAEKFVSRYWKSFEDDFLGKPKFVSWTAIRKRLSSKEKMEKRAIYSPKHLSKKMK
tara:strand:+ start:523 stop:1326 length:804 start_codon:yes stop_codon:yes gene_type:complete